MSNAALKLDIAEEDPCNAIIDRITKVSPDVGTYLGYLMDMLEPYVDDADYCKRPELLDQCFGSNGLKDDINTIIHAIQKVPEGERENLLDNLRELLGAVSDNPIFFRYIEQICDFFKITLHKDTHVPAGEAARFFTQNIVLNPRQKERFLKACYLEPVSARGKGSHTKWLDRQSRKPITISSTSPVVWLKTLIAGLIVDGLPMQRIQAACARLKLHFEVLTN